MRLLYPLSLLLVLVSLAQTLQGADISTPIIPTTEEPMSFSDVGNGGNCDTCAWITAQGVITAETPTKFNDFIKNKQITDPQFPYSLDIVFHSPGGSLSAGLELGRLIRQLHLNTAIARTVKATTHRFWDQEPGLCASACAYAFLGGRSRTIAENSRYGVHQFSFGSPEAKLTVDDKLSSAQAVAGFLAYYVHSMGADPSLLFLAGSAKADEILFLNREQLTELHVTTADQEKLVFKGWALEPHRQGAVAVATTANARGRREEFSIFCRHDTPQQVFLMVSARLWGDNNVASPISAKQLRDNVLMTKLVVDGSTLRQLDKDAGITDLRVEKGARIYVSTNVSQSELGSILRSNTVEFSLDLPHALDWRLGASARVKPGLDHIRLALRNCV